MNSEATKATTVTTEEAQARSLGQTGTASGNFSKLLEGLLHNLGELQVLSRELPSRTETMDALLRNGFVGANYVGDAELSTARRRVQACDNIIKVVQTFRDYEQGFIDRQKSLLTLVLEEAKALEGVQALLDGGVPEIPSVEVHRPVFVVGCTVKSVTKHIKRRKCEQ